MSTGALTKWIIPAPAHTVNFATDASDALIRKVSEALEKSSYTGGDKVLSTLSKSISLKNVFDPDVTTGKLGTSVYVVDGTPSVLPDYRKTTYSAVGGKITAIPCTGGYEIETTEFDGSKTYHPNDVLIPGTTAGYDLGFVTLPASSSVGIGAAPVVGFVSRATFTVDSYQQKRISFWTNFIPATH